MVTSVFLSQMIQLWKKLSRCIRSRSSLAIAGTATLFILVLYVLPNNQNHVITSIPINPLPARHISYTDKLSFSNHTTPKPRKNIPIYTSPLVDGKHINPYHFKFTMLPHPCTDEELVIVVHSAVQYFERRAVMRSTWLNRRNLEKQLALKIKTVFITGKTLNQTVQQHINYEQEMYDDIVQSDFIDSYQNNTYKAISFMRWVSSINGCPEASMVLKVDDDALIHPVKIPKLNKTIHRALDTNSSNVYLGRMLTTLVNRNNASKWCVSWDLWPHERYPIWFQGLAYLLTPQLAAKLPTIALDVKYMFTDDVYVGVLVSQVEGAEVIIEDMFGIHTEGTLDKFLKSFANSGRIFYHVPSIKHFISWYYIDGELIDVDEPLPTTTTTVSMFSGRKLSARHSAMAVVWSLALVILIISIISVCLCYFCHKWCNIT